MQKLIIFLILILSLTSGCATYIKSRANDLADCFTARVGLNYGIGVRTQVTDYVCISAGLSYCEKDIGFFGREMHDLSVGWWCVGVPISQILAPPVFILLGLFGDDPKIGLGLLLGTDTRFDSRFGARSSLLGINTTEFTEHGESGVFLFPATLQEVYPTKPFLRHKFFVEGGVTLFCVGFDAGFNPVEFVDFLLGWTTLDITGDD